MLPRWPGRRRATFLCVAGPSRRHKTSTTLQSFKRIGIPVLAAVLTLACLVMVGFLGTAPALLSPLLLLLLGTATAQQTWLWSPGSAGAGSAEPPKASPEPVEQHRLSPKPSLSLQSRSTWTITTSSANSP